MDSLQGHFLISTPQMPDPRFQEQVVYLCAHNDEGAMGLVINNPTSEITLLDVLYGANLPLPEGPLPPVYVGGPVEQDAGFILFAEDGGDYHSLDVTEGISLSRDARMLEEIAWGRGPEKFLFMLGYAGWGPGQLEVELMDNGWLALPGDHETLFSTPDENKWKMAASRYGINITIFSDSVGYA